MNWMKHALASGLIAAILAPSVAWAVPTYPRPIQIDGKECMETLNTCDGLEVWCESKDRKYVLVSNEECPAAEPMSASSRVPVGMEPDPEPAVDLGVPAATQARFEHAYSSEPPINARAADLLSSAAVKYSWSGPLKLFAISWIAGAGLIFMSDSDDKGTLGALALGVAALQITAALIIDGSARADIREASGRQLASTVDATYRTSSDDEDEEDDWDDDEEEEDDE